MTPSDSKAQRCPKCGTSVPGRRSTCPACGARVRDTSKMSCPSCGDIIPRDSKTCPACNAVIPSKSPKSRSKKVKAPEEPRKEAVQAEDAPRVEEPPPVPACPECGSPLEGPDSICPRCSTTPTEKTGKPCRVCGTTIADGLNECPNCGFAVNETRRTTPPVIVAPHEPELPAVKVTVHRRVSQRPCPSCGVLIPKGVQKCPACLTSLVWPKTPVAQPAPEAQPKESVQSVAPIAPQAVTPKPAKKRILKTAGAGTVTVPALRKAGGMTNGTGQVNGLRRPGAADGSRSESFVNGSGISNGLGGQPKRAAKRTSLITRWQFLAVVVALVIIIPTFMFLSYVNNSQKYSVDGDFGEWNSATTYGTLIQSTVSSTNITEWAVGTQGSDLFLYVRTSANMMGSSTAESQYLFVDSDGSNSTGYMVGSIGADYMLQITGWDSAVRSGSLFKFESATDQYNWTAWTSIGAVSHSLKGDRLEAGATLPAAPGQAARFVLVSKDSSERSSVSCVAPLKGGVLVVEQMQSVDVPANGILARSSSVSLLKLKFTSEGKGGSVDRVVPSISGATIATPVQGFPLAKGQSYEVTIAVDTSAAPDGRLVSAELTGTDITSSFTSVQIVGSPAVAYVGSAPSSIVIDGAFGDWTGRTSTDSDASPAISPSTDINQVGNVSTALDSFFYVSVKGDICSGTFVPATVSKPSGTGGGGAVVQSKRTAEDILQVFIDSDRSPATGKPVALQSKLIGADRMVEVRGLFGRITSVKEFDYSTSGKWTATTDQVKAAKDTKRMEIGVTAASLGGSASVDFIVETTSWNGLSDLATFDPTAIASSTKSWVVDPSTSSPYATSMSYQRKSFYDGMNHWSFYFDGTNTISKYSTDGGQTWTYGGRVFATTGVNETSIWYDISNRTLYAVGDSSTATNRVYVQVGTVDAAAHTISWAAKDYGPKTSTLALAGKNTYISMDNNGYLWVLSSNFTGVGAYRLSAFRSSSIDNASSWVFSGQMLTGSSPTDNLKGSIVPAGSGGDMWAVYTYSGNVAARKFAGIWQVQQWIYQTVGSRSNTDNSPPSVVVDAKGVVHVVYGTGRRTGGGGTPSIPTIQYSHNNTGLTTFTTSANLDQYIPSGVGDYYPTISLDNSTGALYVFWLRSDTTLAPKTVVGRVNSSGVWSNLTLGAQTDLSKQFLTSIYSVQSVGMICWQWTQNTTAPSQVYFDTLPIPELSGLLLPVVSLIALVVLFRPRARSRRERD